MSLSVQYITGFFYGKMLVTIGEISCVFLERTKSKCKNKNTSFLCGYIVVLYGSVRTFSFYPNTNNRQLTKETELVSNLLSQRKQEVTELPTGSESTCTIGSTRSSGGAHLKFNLSKHKHTCPVRVALHSLFGEIMDQSSRPTRTALYLSHRQRGGSNRHCE